MEAKWQQGHEAIMELEKTKNKLKAEIEVFETQRRELSETLADLRKCIMADKGDYGTYEAERIFRIEDLDEQVVKSKTELEEKQEELKGATQRNEGLLASSTKLENEIEKKTKINLKLESETEQATNILNKIKILRQEEEEKRRIKLAKLRLDIEENSKKLDNIRVEYEQKRIHNLAEERRLSIKRSDLEIYEQRMRRKYSLETFVLKEDAITSEDKN